MNLLTLIEEAFAQRPKPHDVVLPGVPHTDIYEDALVFRGKQWQELTCAILDRYAGAVYGFSPDAFCYFLPGIYTAGIRENRPDLLVNSSLVSTLDRGNSPASWDEFFLARWPLLGERECDATQQWLLWLADAAPVLPGIAVSRAFDTVTLLSNKSRAIPMAGRSRKA